MALKKVLAIIAIYKMLNGDVQGCTHDQFYDCVDQILSTKEFAALNMVNGESAPIFKKKYQPIFGKTNASSGSFAIMKTIVLLNFVLLLTIISCILFVYRSFFKNDFFNQRRNPRAHKLNDLMTLVCLHNGTTGYWTLRKSQ